MYRESTAVPLIISGSDVPPGAVCRTHVNLVDVYPTVLDNFDLEFDAERSCVAWSIIISHCNELGMIQPQRLQRISCCGSGHRIIHARAGQ